MAELTETQRRVLQFLRKFHRKHRYPPNLNTIADELGVTKQAAWETLTRLVRDERVKRVGNVGSWIAVGP